MILYFSPGNGEEKGARMRDRFAIDPAGRERFEREGLLLLRAAVAPELCDALRALGEVQLRERIPPFESEGEYLGSERREFRETLRRLRQVYDRDPLFRHWMEWPAIRPLLAELLGAPPVLVTAHHNALMSKMPATSSETRWHRDRRYWHYADDRLLSVWLALGEEHEANGVLEFIPGSHRVRFPPEAFDAREYFREEPPENRAWIARKVRYDLEKGDLVLFHASLLHRAGPNRTERPKLSLVYTVRAADNAPLPGTRSAKFREIPLPL
jgi:phytanoyl-CoA hydroxylase